MKKLFTLMTVALFAMTISAQNLGVIGVQRAKASAPKMIDAAEGQIWWSYGDIFNEPNYGLLGTETAETYNVAMQVTGDNDIVVGSQIKAIRVPLHEKSVIKDLKVWLSVNQPASYTAASVCHYEVDDADLVDLSTDNKMVEVVLDEPYTVTQSGVYVGYTFTVKSASTQGGKYPIVLSQETGISNSLYLNTPYVGGKWMDGKSYGASALQILIEGEFVENQIAVSNFSSVALLPNATEKASIEVTNLGTNAINNVSYTVTYNGNTSEETTVETSIPMSRSAFVDVNITGIEDLGEYDCVVKFTKVNGVAIEGVEATGKVEIISEIKEWERRVLIEEFTTEPCGYCPDAAKGLEQFHTTYPDVAEKTSTICHHAGFYTDWLTISASSSYTWFYGTGGTYAPAFMWDRYNFPGSSDNVPVESRPNGGAGHRTKVQQRLAIPSYANLDLNVVLNEDQSKMQVTVDCERGKNIGNNTRLFVFVTEDNITARNQSGASGTFIHQHVARTCNETWGASLNWSNNKATYTKTFDINSAWGVDDLKVVAFIANYDSTNRNNCVVENVAEFALASLTGITETSATQELTEVARYSVDGRQLSQPEAGINIVRLSNGETVKVLVK